MPYIEGMPVVIDCPEKQGSGLCTKCGLPLDHHQILLDVIHDDSLCYQVVVLKSASQHLLLHISQAVYRDKFIDVRPK